MATDIEHLLCGQVGGWAGGGRWCCPILQMRMGVQLSGEWPSSMWLTSELVGGTQNSGEGF